MLDPASARGHRAASWCQETWEKNVGYIVEGLTARLGRELASPARRYASLETLGLAEVTYPGLDTLAPLPWLGQVNHPAVREKLRACWTDLLASLCDTLRADGVITLGSDKLDVDYDFAGARVGKWCAEQAAYKSWVVRFIGVEERQRRRRFAQVVLQKCGLPEKEAVQLAPELLRAVFGQLVASAQDQVVDWLEAEQMQTSSAPSFALRLRFPKLALRRPLKLYYSAKTRRFWPRSVQGCAHEVGCDDLQEALGDVEEVAARLDNDPRIGRQRQELAGEAVFRIGLWAEEHTAQLSPRENRRLQDLFKRGARNVLSSTTTLELGIDIGGLSGVLMGNVPPGRANYLQRAGRAGRRADGSSMVVTFTRPRPFDREVFHRFGDYLRRLPRRPRVLLNRERIACRHAHAFLLSEFFRIVYPPGMRVGAMNAFGNMGRFCGAPVPPRWENDIAKPDPDLPKSDWGPPPSAAWWNASNKDPGLEGHFVEYLRYLRDDGSEQFRPVLRSLFEAVPVLLKCLENWPAFLDSVISDFTNIINAWKAGYDELLRAWKDIDEGKPNARRQANFLRYKLVSLFKVTVIETLADRQFLPRYGFPVGVQRLVVLQEEEEDGRVRHEDQYRLERRGLLALRDYVPGSQLLVGGRLVTSRGILKHWTGAAIDNPMGLSGKYTTCKGGHFYYSVSSATLPACPVCGKDAGPVRSLLLPHHGFTTAAWDPPRLSTDVERVGTVEQQTITFTTGATTNRVEPFGDVPGLLALYQEDGELLVYNEGDNRRGFAICTACGYADSERDLASGTQRLPSGFEQHTPLREPDERKRCWKDSQAAPVLRNQTLAAREATDVLMLCFSGAKAGLGSDLAQVRTLAHALQIAGARLLELDTRELGVLTAPHGQGSHGAVIYDNVPGGAGHVLELMQAGREWLEQAQDVLFVDAEHDSRCTTACLDCLLTFDAQEAISQGLLERRRTHTLLKQLLGS
jgi:hypothetical protein